MTWISRVALMAEIVLAELLFLYPAEKRRPFAVRLILSLAACAVIAVWLPGSGRSGSQLQQFLHFTSLFLVSVAAMGASFKLKLPALVSSCAAGYAVEHIAFHITKIAIQYGFMAGVRTAWLSNRLVCEAIMFPIVYLAFFLTVGLYSARNQCYKKADMRFNVLSIVIIFICIGLTRVSGYFGDFNSVTVSLYAIVAALMALIVQLVLSKIVELQHINETMSLLWKKDRQHYEQSKRAIDTINIKYHDLKHMLRDLRIPQEEIAAIESAVQVYGSQVRTGSEALDILLTENTLRLEEEGIILTYMGNGGDLGFMSTVDVYSLFGNAVNNAVEAVRGVKDPEKRIINIVTERKGDLVSINISNYFAGELIFEDGLPATTKTEEKGFHGFGMRSMKLIAEKYGGGLTAAADGEVFNLGIYLMQG